MMYVLNRNQSLVVKKIGMGKRDRVEKIIDLEKKMYKYQLPNE